MKSKEEIEQLAEALCHTMESRFGFAWGYEHCQEDMADKKYTEEDLREAIDMSRMLSHVSCLGDGEHRLKYSNTEEDIINSLNKQD